MDILGQSEMDKFLYIVRDNLVGKYYGIISFYRNEVISMIGIYKITNTLNGHSYIGLSCHIERRWQEHKLPYN